MKKTGVMVVAALLSASMFAHAAGLPTKTKTVNGSAVKTEVKKHKQDKDKTKSKDKGAKKEKAHKKEGKEQKTTPAKAQK